MKKYITPVVMTCLGITLSVLLGYRPTDTSLSASVPISLELPALQVYPLPASLAAWQDVENRGDYFDQIQPTDVGYLIWRQFPVRVYVEQPVSDRANAARVAAWTQAVTEGITEWNRYLPLVLVANPEQADITIWRVVPPLQRQNPGDGRSSLGRVRSAETRYQLYSHHQGKDPPVLVHRCYIHLSPNQTIPYIRAAARHEMGHALGIWGHSPLPSDVMYFAQVRTPPPISPRDVNTLKRIYEQPTRLGGQIPTQPT
ncbi:MAG: peptidase [Cyanobacteria bacterium]|nr:peptidase [Cyanobacteriota bacterium]MDW8202461.1 peptidase [Cyanobacteriota bacterium SKYGB_h_bin112]